MEGKISSGGSELAKQLGTPLTFNYIGPIRKIIYATNTVEGYPRQVRKVTKYDEILLDTISWISE